MKISGLSRVGAVMGVLTAFSGSLIAEETVDPGETKFETCSGCHSRAGYANAVPRYQVPKLGGQHAAYLKSSLKAYASGERRHGSMEGNAAGLNDQDIEEIAAYLSQFEDVDNDDNFTGDPVAGKEKAETCAGCHGEGGVSSDENFPKLAGQYESYLVEALRGYKSGSRNNPMMTGMVSGLSDEDIENIAAYYASQKTGLGIIER